MMTIQDLAKTGDDLKFKMTVMPIYSKKNRRLLLENNWAGSADILQEAYGALPYIK